MLELQNRTPFAAAIVPGLDKTGLETLTVVLKGTFSVVPGQTELAIAEEQGAIRLVDEFFGDPALSSVKYEGDAAPAKRGTDVVLVGHAVSARPVRVLDVMLTAGPLAGVLRVFGDRVWTRGIADWKASEPAPFTRMPLVYERAFGGVDGGEAEARNPVGMGFLAKHTHVRVEGVRLPNVEDPRALVEKPGDRPAPAGFGFVSRAWMPRRAYAGTYDERWKRERFPFLPEDFDERFFDAAGPNLTTAEPLRGGEQVVVTNVLEEGELRFHVPRRLLGMTVSVKGKTSEHVPELATLLMEPDEQRVSLTWRVTVPVPRAFLYIDFVRVTEEAAL